MISWFAGWCRAARPATFSPSPPDNAGRTLAASLSCSADAKVSTPRVSSWRRTQTPEPPFVLFLCLVPNVQKVRRCFLLMICWHATFHPRRGGSKIRSQRQRTSRARAARPSVALPEVSSDWPAASAPHSQGRTRQRPAADPKARRQSSRQLDCGAGTMFTTWHLCAI